MSHKHIILTEAKFFW